jgi:dTDP-4-amino-4,6-dideoxygalactose transaminase
MAPVSANEGNIDPAAVPDATWSSLGGVLTTNLYGLPDRVAELRARCDRLGIPLIEDAAHAIQTEVDGRPIGSFGAAAAFSLSKHARAGGGAWSPSPTQPAGPGWRPCGTGCCGPAAGVARST